MTVEQVTRRVVAVLAVLVLLVTAYFATHAANHRRPTDCDGRQATAAGCFR